jgi:hypothetical protein
MPVGSEEQYNITDLLLLYTPLKIGAPTPTQFSAYKPVDTMFRRTVYSKIRNRLQLRTLNDFMLTHISRHTSTIMASCFSDPALAYFPITRDMWTAA